MARSDCSVLDEGEVGKVHSKRCKIRQDSDNTHTNCRHIVDNVTHQQSSLADWEYKTHQDPRVIADRSSFLEASPRHRIELFAASLFNTRTRRKYPAPGGAGWCPGDELALCLFTDAVLVPRQGNDATRKPPDFLDWGEKRFKEVEPRCHSCSSLF